MGDGGQHGPLPKSNKSANPKQLHLQPTPSTLLLQISNPLKPHFVAGLMVIYGSRGGGGDESERKTSAKPGAGNGIVHVLLETLQSMMVTLRLRLKRPSTERSPPKI